jgi:hypothetical protein
MKFFFLLLLLCYLMLMLTLIYLGIIVSLLPLYTVIFCILFYTYFCVSPYIRANFVIGLCAVKFARK